jgi:hypothetical protein
MENEKRNWEAPKLIIITLNQTEAGSMAAGSTAEGSHTISSINLSS